MTLYTWSWLFLFGYILAMVGFGVLGNRKVAGADDYAVARAGYGPAVLAVAFASTAVSGATFVGLPALTYTYGMSTLWIAFLYAAGLYTGILICQRTIGRYGNVAGARSIPEYLGERYQSEALRISAAVLSLILLFYLAGQLVAGLVMFEMMLGLLPHIGNKLWALSDERARNRFLVLAFTFGLILPAITLGGALARGALGDSLLADGGGGANSALPALFLEIFPTWLAALVGVGVLAAVMSTADGLVISTSQVFANDIFRRSIAPRWLSHLQPSELDRRVLLISRLVTVLVLLGSAGLAWSVMDMNIVLLVWVGIGGFTAALAGPLVLGSVWSGVTRAGALWGFWTGAILFVLIHSEALSGHWPAGTILESFGRWFDFYATSPYSAATLAGLTAVMVTVVVSSVTECLPAEHVARVRQPNGRLR